MIDKLLTQYAKVFNSDNSQKLCGREECKKLICLCEEYSGQQNVFGNKENGIMLIDNIKKLVLDIQHNLYNSTN
jgi:hypothetical protein